jgi:hypothetical protein
MHRFLPMFYKPEVAHNGRTDISPQSVATDCASGADTPLKMRSVRASFGYAIVTCAALGYQTRGRRYEFFFGVKFHFVQSGRRLPRRVLSRRHHSFDVVLQ